MSNANELVWEVLKHIPVIWQAYVVEKNKSKLNKILKM